MELGVARRPEASSPAYYRIAEIAFITLLYFALAKASLLFASINPSASPIWPPTGLAVAVVLIRGNHVLTAIALGAFAANLATTGSVGSSLAIALGNALEAAIAVYLMSKWAQGRDAFSSPSGIVKFAIIVTAVATPVSATIGVAALISAGYAEPANFLHIWSTWWLGDIAGALIVAPVIVLWASSFEPRASIAVETLLTFLLAILVGLIAFSPLTPAIFSPKAMAFSAVLPLLWAALRQSPKETAMVALILSAFAIWGVTAGEGPFVAASLNESFMLLVAFVASATLPSLALSAAVTARDKALRKHEEVYHLLVDSVPDYAIIMLDPQGRVVSWNSGAERINHYKEMEILGSDFGRFYTEEARRQGEPERALDNAVRFGRFESEGWRVRKDGSRYWASAVLNAIRQTDGKLLGFAQVMRDTTEKRESQLALERAREELFQSQKLEAIGQLTGGIAHDFNNLLMAISAGVRMLDKPQNGPKRAEITEALNQAVERGANLTNQLLNFARRESLRPEIINTAERLHGMRILLARSLREDIIVEIECAPDLWSVRVDPNQFELVILNLAVNARDAMPHGGLLKITADNVRSHTADYARITISDTGTGMTPEVQARAFDPFYTTKETGKGTGLGLSQVYGFVKRSGGTATLESQRDRGTTVTLMLPRAYGESEYRDPVDVAPPNLPPCRILVVEDDDTVAAVVTDMVEQLGHGATRVSNAQGALMKLEGGDDFDLIFTDIIIPGGMNGVELAQQIRRRFPALPVLLTTGYSGALIPSDYMGAVLRKPYGPEELAKAIARARSEFGQDDAA